MKKAKPVSVVLAAMLALSGNALSAADNVAASTNRSGSVLTNAVAPARMSRADAADAARALAVASTNLSAPVNMESEITVASNSQTFSVDACCSEIRTADFTLPTDGLTQTPSDASAHRNVRFFRGAVISMGRSGDSAEWREREPATFDRYPANVSWVGGDAAAQREPRGLKLFSWSW